MFNDTNLDAAVKGVLISKFRNSGQTFVCANRIYVQEGVYETFIAKFVDAVKSLNNRVRILKFLST
ncbi:aldehyde dehydrogenase family protein [Histophilus somni]|uniref:Aldehyde dehydrogenase n=1 Tax=Histophilus somni (strain 129Pt) TaxID=205914 RepID=Q0I5Y7_HISS1